MNIFKFELLRLKKTTIIWTIVLNLSFILLFCLYPAYYNNKEEVLSKLQGLSEDSLKALNINIETLFTPLGFYSFIFVYISFIAAIQASVVGFGVMINDSVENASIFILTKPYNRKDILKRKIQAAILTLFISHIVFQLLSISLIYFIKDDSQVDIFKLLLINLGLFLSQLSFFCFSLIIGAYIKKPKAILVLSIIMIFVFYILSIIENITNNFILRYTNPFSYFKVSDVLSSGFYKDSFIIATIFIIFFGINFAYGSYENDDIMEV